MKRLAGIASPPLATLAAATLVACGSPHGASSSNAPGTGTGARATSGLPSGGDCQSLIARTLGTVAGRIYDAARHGNVVGQAVHRVETSTALADAVSTNDAPAARATLRSLLAGQIVGIQLTKAGKVFAETGTDISIAPVRGAIEGTDARFVLSTQAAPSYLKVTHQVTGADVVLIGSGNGRVVGSTLPDSALPARLPPRGRIKLAGRSFRAYSIQGSLFPEGALRIVLLVPPTHGARCPSSPGQAAVETIGHVGERIYREEADSPYVRTTLHHIEHDPGFQQAVAARNTAAIRAAIVRFFGAHIHVVRVRAFAVEPSGAQRFLYDLGGPYVLAPVHGVVRSGGRLVGRFSFAIQDDAGYLRLAQLFTGAKVLMRVGPSGERQVMGSLKPGPEHIPDRGLVSYRGRSYEAYSFTGEAFPSGPLRISLLLPA